MGLLDFADGVAEKTVKGATSGKEKAKETFNEKTGRTQVCACGCGKQFRNPRRVTYNKECEKRYAQQIAGDEKKPEKSATKKDKKNTKRGLI